MTAAASPDVQASGWQHDEQLLHGWAERLASVDMWTDAARLVLAALPVSPEEPQRMNAAWVCLRGGQPYEARRLMQPLASNAPHVIVLRAAADVLCDVPGAYDTFIDAVEQSAAAGSSVHRLTAMCAAHMRDWPRSISAARRLLTTEPHDADMLVLIAADLAVQGCWQQALAAVERARSDRFTCQVDPASETISLLLKRDSVDEAAYLAAAGYANTARQGWQEQVARMRDRQQDLSRDTALALHAASRVQEGKPVQHSAAPLPVVVAGALASWAVQHVAAKASAVARHVPGAPALGMTLLHAVDVTGTAALQALTSREVKTHDPARCSCWETDWYSGPEARSYVEQHLESVTVSESLGLVVRRCPSLQKTWLDLPDAGFTVTIEDPQGAAAAVVAAPPTAAEDEPSVGFYL